MKARFALVAPLGVAVAAGAGHAQEPGSFLGEGCVLDTEAATCDDCISFEHVTTLGSDQLGPGFLVDTGAMDVVRDSLGNYWVGQEELIKVFDAHGAFMRVVGRRGEGPMEFGRARPTHVDASGRVHVVDTDNRRISVIDQSFTLVEDKSVPLGISAMAALNDGDRYVVGASPMDPVGEGMTLHVIDASGILNSFRKRDVPDPGSLDSFIESQMSDGDLRLAAGAAGGMLAARQYEYVVEAWSQEGVRLGGLRGSPDLNPRGFSPFDPPSADNPVPNGVFKVRADAGGRLWVSLLVRRPEWQDRLLAAGGLGGAPADIVTALYQGRLDVIDSATCGLVASQLLEQPLYFLDDETVLGYGFTELGANTLDVLRVELKP